MRRRHLLTLVALGVLSVSGAASAAPFPNDAVAYHRGPVISPLIVCLMWSPPASAGGFTTSDVQARQDYLLGMDAYFTNSAVPPGALSGSGSEPVPRQYGVWGAFFNGTCTTDTRTPTGAINVFDDSPNSVIATEIKAVFGVGVFTPNTVVVVFTKLGNAQGWSYASGQNPRHWTIGSGQYLSTIPEGLSWDYTIVSHELIEAGTDPAFSAWTSPQEQGCGRGSEVCDDGYYLLGVTMRFPTADGFGNSNNSYVLASAIDNIDGGNGDPVSTCPYDSGLCAAIGNTNQCLQPGAQAFSSLYAFTNQTTTPPVAVVQAAGTINVIARTATGIIHLVPPSTSGGSFTQLPSPAGWVSETPTVFSTDGTSIDMYGRGSDAALYHWTYNGSAWSPYTFLGGAVNGPPSAAHATINGTATTAVVVMGADMKLWGYVNGTWFNYALPPNVLMASPPQIFNSHGTCFDVTFGGTDGNEYRQDCWPNGSWVKGSNSASLGLVTQIDKPVSASYEYLFSSGPVGIGGSGQSWATTFQGSTAVVNAALPTLVTTGPIAARPGLFGSGVAFLAATSNGAVYETSGTPAGGFASWGVVPPSQLHTATSPPVLFTPDGASYWLFVRSTWAGQSHLMYKYFTPGQTIIADTGAFIL